VFANIFVINKKLPQDNLASCFYNHNELDLRNGFFREEEVFVWTLYKYTIKTQEICLQISNDDLPQVMIRGG
jgi:predicted DNA binding CopG/RHH family protein